MERDTSIKELAAFGLAIGVSAVGKAFTREHGLPDKMTAIQGRLGETNRPTLQPSYLRK
ncbi:Uncharacterised protein [Yersinia bercovieri]|nr:Uncharacterised protein [Yersinia bercovieri]CNF69153.1 Uncharacterised protein [Yersinia bercovieri]CNI55217.1 Uncharacterised protein [Yersinia bercovieri]